MKPILIFIKPYQWLSNPNNLVLCAMSPMNKCSCFPASMIHVSTVPQSTTSKMNPTILK